MKIFRPLASLLVLACSLMLLSCKTTEPEGKTERRDVLYLCSCGAECKCKVASTKPGKCGCGHDLIPGHLRKMEGDTALLCMCGTDCGCSIDPKNATKCGCGKPLRKISLKGSGIYFCICGSTCACNTVSDQPGQCKCGKQLKKVD